MIKKRIIPICICCAVLLLIFAPCSFATNTVNHPLEVSFAEPPASEMMAYVLLTNGGGAAYLPSPTCAFFTICSPLQNSSSDVFSIFIELDVDLQTFTIIGSPGLPIYISVCNRFGSKTSDVEYTIPQTGVLTLTYHFVTSVYMNYWAKGNISIFEPNGQKNYSNANVIFAEDAYSVDLLTNILSNLVELNDSIDTANTTLTNIQSNAVLIAGRVNTIITSLSSFYTRNHTDLNNIYARLLLILNKEGDIYNLLYEYLVQETVPINDPTDAYEDMVEAEQALVVTDQNGETIDAASQVAIAFSEAASGVGQLGDGVTSINTLITQLFSAHWIVIIPVFVALGLGLVVTILGKNKSD